MLDEILHEIPFQYTLWIVAIIAALVLIIIKSAPTISKWFNSAHSNVNHVETIDNTLKEHTNQLAQLSSSVKFQGERLDQVERGLRHANKTINSNVEESELIIHALLSIIQGIRELGANGSTKQAEDDIQSYLLSKSHSKFLHNNPFIDESDEDWPDNLDAIDND